MLSELSVTLKTSGALFLLSATVMFADASYVTLNEEAVNVSVIWNTVDGSMVSAYWSHCTENGLLVENGYSGYQGTPFAMSVMFGFPVSSCMVPVDVRNAKSAPAIVIGAVGTVGSVMSVVLHQAKFVIEPLKSGPINSSSRSVVPIGP